MNDCLPARAHAGSENWGILKGEGITDGVASTAFLPIFALVSIP